jgi:hypothetical protein
VALAAENARIENPLRIRPRIVFADGLREAPRHALESMSRLDVVELLP